MCDQSLRESDRQSSRAIITSVFTYLFWQLELNRIVSITIIIIIVINFFWLRLQKKISLQSNFLVRSSWTKRQRTIIGDSRPTDHLLRKRPTPEHELVARPSAPSFLFSFKFENKRVEAKTKFLSMVRRRRRTMSLQVTRVKSTC